MSTIAKQKGVAAIVFMLFLPCLIMTFAFAVGYSQRLLAHAKLEEATEVASLALIASPKKNNEEDKEYARSLIDLYVADNINNIDVKVTTETCKTTQCVEDKGELSPFTDFVVSASTEHKSWIVHNDIGVNPQFKVSGSSVTRKFLPQPVDIYFIVDISQSMHNIWSGEAKTQMQVVKDTIDRVVKELSLLKTDKKSKVSLITYNAYNIKGVSNSRERQLYNYRVNEKNKSRTPAEVVEAMFKPGAPIKNYPYAHMYNTAEDVPLTDKYKSFRDMIKSSKITQATGGGTESWQGIISAAQEANNVKTDERNPEQVFIILSDGADSDVTYTDTHRTKQYEKENHVISKYDKYNGRWYKIYDKYLKTLVVDNKLCEKIKETIGKKKNRFTSDNNRKTVKTKVTMGVIGINYTVKEDDGFGDCVGKQNIYHAEKGKDVYKHILNLINEETGRLKD